MIFEKIDSIEDGQDGCKIETATFRGYAYFVRTYGD